MLPYLDRYVHRLFGNPLALDAAEQVVSVVERTNNSAEHYFFNAKRKLRRRLGDANLGRSMHDQRAQTAPAAYLLERCQVHVLLGSLEQLPVASAILAKPALPKPCQS